MELDPTLAVRVKTWWAGNRPPFATHITRPTETCLTIASGRGAGYTNRQTGEALYLSEKTTKTYHRDSAAEWGMSQVELQRAAVAHMAVHNRELLLELLG